jgi:hypothetical protein
MPEDTNITKTDKDTGDIKIQPDALPLPAWKAGLDEELRNDPLLSQFTGEDDVPKVIREYVHAQRKIGQKGVLIPKKDAKPEEWEKFFTDLGRPQKAAGYALGKPPDWPENLPYQQEAEEAFRKAAFEAGLPASQVEKIFKWYTGFSLDQWHAYEKAAEEAHKTAEKALRKEWGPDFDNNFKAAGGVLVKYGGENLAGRQDLKNDPDLVKFLFQVSKVLGEDQFVAGSPGDQGTLDGQIAEVDKKMQEMVAANKGGEGNPEYVALMKRRDRLYELKHPGSPGDKKK